MGKILGMFLWIRARLREPSTHAALSSVFLSFGLQYPEQQVGHWLTVLSLLFGAAGFLVKEQGPETRV